MQRVVNLRGHRHVTRTSCRPNVQHSAIESHSLERPGQAQRRKNKGRAAPAQRQRASLHVVAATDYAPAANDEGVLLRPLKEELFPPDVQHVFHYPRNLRERYALGKVVGAGSFGVVRAAVELATERRYACKTIPKAPKRGKCTPRYLLKLQSEVDSMVQLGTSLDAVFLKDVFEDNDSIHMVMELCTGGSILERLETTRYTERQIARIMRSVLRFIAQCHAKGIIYRDVKPDNFLFASTQPDAAVKATDFGLSIRHWPHEEPLRSRSGTPAYMAPEVVMQEYDNRADLWSVGILMYQLLTGRFPFWDNVRACTLQEVWKAILADPLDMSSPEVAKAISPPARDLLTQLLQREPSMRISAAAALSHPWIKEDGVASDLPLGGSVVQRLQRFATYGHLKQMVLKMITDELEIADDGNGGLGSGLSMADLRALFVRMDGKGSGRVAAEELAAGLRSLGYDIADSDGEQLLLGLDINGDGGVTFDEFAACLIDWQQLREDALWSEWTDLAFGRFDTNGDGFISLDELLARLPEDTQETRVLEAKRMLREADTNMDGRISRREFQDLLVGSSVPDSLLQYDPRVKVHAVDEDLMSMDVPWRSGT